MKLNGNTKLNLKLAALLIVVGAQSLLLASIHTKLSALEKMRESRLSVEELLNDAEEEVEYLENELQSCKTGINNKRGEP